MNTENAPSLDRRTEVLGTMEMIAAMILAGSTVVAAKLITGCYSVFFIGAASMAFTLITMLPLQIIRIRELLSLRPADLRSMFFQALFGIVLFRVFILLGLRSTSAFTAGIITSTSPAVLGFLAFLILKERLGSRKIISVVLATAGIILLNLFGSGAAGTGFGGVWGNVLILLAVISEALLTIFRKSSKKKVSSITNTMVLSFFALVLFLAFMIGEKIITGKGLPRFTAVPIRDWLILAYYGGFATALAYICWGDAALKISAGQTGIITACMPLTAMVLSFCLLKEKIYWYHLAGAAVVLAGLSLGCRKSVYTEVSLPAKEIICSVPSEELTCHSPSSCPVTSDSTMTRPRD